MSDLEQVLIIEDHPLFRQALASVLRLAFPGSISREASTLDAAVDVLEKEGLFDVVMLDLNLAGVEGLVMLRALFPRQPLLVFAGSGNARTVDEAIACGASGFLSRIPGQDTLFTAICTILRGDIYLPDPSSLFHDGDGTLVGS